MSLRLEHVNMLVSTGVDYSTTSYCGVWSVSFDDDDIISKFCDISCDNCPYNHDTLRGLHILVIHKLGD